MTVVFDQNKHVLLKIISGRWTAIRPQLICAGCSGDVISVSQFRELVPCLQTEDEEDEELMKQQIDSNSRNMSEAADPMFSN